MTTVRTYTGDMEDVCPISFVPIKSISHPVGFDSAHAFECECIVEWLTKHRCINPVTGQELGPVPIRNILYPLIIEEEYHLAQTISILSNAGSAIDSEVLKKISIISKKVLTNCMSRQPPSPIGFPAPPTTWQQKVQTDLTLTAAFVVLELVGHIWWAVIATDNVMFAPFVVIPVNAALFGSALKAFCTDYPLNGHLVFAMIIVGYAVMRVVENLTQNRPLWDEPLSHHIHVLDMVFVAIKFMLDFATIVMRYDVR